MFASAYVKMNNTPAIHSIGALHIGRVNELYAVRQRRMLHGPHESIQRDRTTCYMQYSHITCVLSRSSEPTLTGS